MATHAHSTVAPARRRLARRHLEPAPQPHIAFLDASSFPELYGMRLTGDCLAPDLLDGDEVVFSSVEPPVVGEFAIFILRPELVQPGQCQSAIKRLAMAIPPYVTFPWTENPKSDVHAVVMAQQLNPPGQFMIKCDRLLAVHKFIRVQNRKVRA